MELPSTLASVSLLRRLSDLVDTRLGVAPKVHRPPPLGPVLVAAKRAFRLSFQPFINEILDRQTHFNSETISWGRALTRDVEGLERSMMALRTSLDLRLARLEESVQRLEAAVAAEQASHATAHGPGGPRSSKPNVGA